MSTAPVAKKMVTVTATGQSAAIRPSHDRKVAFRKGQFNNFGLLPGNDGTCPGATHGPGGCSNIPAGRKGRTCYVYGLMRAYSGVRSVLAANTFAMTHATKPELVALLTNEFERFRDSEVAKAEPKLAYRLHWSGDVFSQTYAEALVEAMAAFPEVRFWTYTRNFVERASGAQQASTNTGVVKTLLRAANLRLYLSLDPVNVVNGLECMYALNPATQAAPAEPNLQICYMAKTDDFAEQFERARATAANRHLWPEVAPKLSACPVDIGKIPLVGGCAKCQKCIGLRQRLLPIFFAT